MALELFSADAEGVENSVAADIRAVYQQRLQSLQADLIQLQHKQRVALAILASLLVAGGMSIWLTWHLAAIASAVGLVTLAGALAFLRTYGSRQRNALADARLCGFYERGIQRLQNDWQAKGSAGDEFVRMVHPYQTDLNILGRGSLFELLCTTRSSAGAERLASYLLDPTDITQARSRQTAVQELCDATALRESLALAGKYEFQGCDPHVLREWLRRPVIEVPRIVSLLLLLCSSVCFTLATLLLSRVLDWHQVPPFVLLPFLVQMAISAMLFKRAQPVLAALPALDNELSVLGDGLALMQRHSFQSEKLKHLVETLRCPDADPPIRKLKHLVRISERRTNNVLYSFSLWFSVGTQLALAVERWRKLHARNLERWLEVWAEFEALNALACYAHEHSEYVFPELVEGATVFEAQALGHPLLPRHACVGNDVRLNPAMPFYLVTGSNMAGKSTWLRALGVNAVLAAAGAPVRATHARMSLFTVYPSIGVGDSLSDGKSKFLAEIERLQETIRFAKRRAPVLFLIDEILGGTNSADRKTIAEALVHVLVNAGAVGVVSTHDHSLIDIADLAGFCGVSVHMASRTPDDPLSFDYRIKPGPAQQSNALAICRMLGMAIRPRR